MIDKLNEMTITIVAFTDHQPNSVSYKKFKGEEALDKAAHFYRKMIEKECVSVISTRKVFNAQVVRISLKLLKEQINDLLESNIPEDSKTGLHHLLGALLDGIEDKMEFDIMGVK